MRLQDIIAELESLAPPYLAESWDNTGLLLGDRTTDIQRVMTCLTLTPDVVAEAVARNVQLMVSHHPLMFKPLQRITADTIEGQTLWNLAKHGIAVYSPHTSWDNAPLGINQQLAERLKLHDVEPIRRQMSPAGYKLVTFVPVDTLDVVQRALWDAGCGEIGNYTCCSFVSPGHGSFWGNSSAEPVVGQSGQLERVEELRLEVLCPKSRLQSALAALRLAHTYEEPAIDVIPVESLASPHGAGRMGTLAKPCTLTELAATVREKLPSSSVQFVGDPQTKVSRVGIACGSAAEFWKESRQAGCDVLLTGESRFHGCLEVRDAGFAMILAGHFATEHLGMEQLAALLSERCSGLTVTASQWERDPLQTH
ncbi:Nif3-like dinuclear metal center hexameric protein [bacterium]|nr:Nif3-like dinuclear metal center hexameric protein [bacterium]